MMCERCEHLEYLLEEITTIPPEAHEALKDTTLSRGQKRILGLLLGHPGMPVSRDQLIAAVHVSTPFVDCPRSDVVDAHICNIRKRLGPDSPIEIKTEWGIGYSARIKEPAHAL
jgi:DNA-binding response OmpR family regulator